METRAMPDRAIHVGHHAALAAHHVMVIVADTVFVTGD
jgi:hypothetical protein